MNDVNTLHSSEKLSGMDSAISWVCALNVFTHVFINLAVSFDLFDSQRSALETKTSEGENSLCRGSDVLCEIVYLDKKLSLLQQQGFPGFFQLQAIASISPLVSQLMSMDAPESTQTGGGKQIRVAAPPRSSSLFPASVM